MTQSVTAEQLATWSTDDDIVAVHVRQTLVPIEGPGGVFFPPTYAGIGYQTNTLHDGTLMVEVDSVGSQANRMEPVFLKPELQGLVPAITVRYGSSKDGNAGELSILEAGHRLGDAIVRSTELHPDARAAFQALLRSGNATPIAKLGPTSLVFGVWDSRDTMAKIPRLLQATIRAYDIVVLKRSAQFNPALDYAELEVFSESDKEKAEGKASSPLAERGFVHVPAVESPGGVIARGPINRDLTLNLVQLHRLQGDDTPALRDYLLGLALIASTEPMDPFLRQGCVLVPDSNGTTEHVVVRRDGSRTPVHFDRDVIFEFAKSAANRFGVGQDRTVDFDKKLAVTDSKAKK